MNAPDLSGARWFKSTHSQPDSACVEVAFLDGGEVAVRDSKDRSGPILRFTPTEWTAFLTGAKTGEFDPTR